MGIIVNFKSGAKQVFIVHQDILATEFRHLAETVGGRINSVEFMSSLQCLNSIISESKRTF